MASGLVLKIKIVLNMKYRFIKRKTCTSDDKKILKKNSSGEWLCVDDEDKFYPNTDKLKELSCEPGKIAKWNGSLWTCATDLQEEFQAAQACPDSQDSCIVNHYGHWQWRHAAVADLNAAPLTVGGGPNLGSSLDGELV